MKNGEYIQYSRIFHTVTKIDKAKKHIRVTFGIGEKTFIFPDAFKQGFLKMKGE